MANDKSKRMSKLEKSWDSCYLCRHRPTQTRVVYPEGGPVSGDQEGETSPPSLECCPECGRTIETVVINVVYDR